MSRTRKGTKPLGYDFWSKRPKTFKNDKDLTRRAERREAKEEAKYVCDWCGADMDKIADDYGSYVIVKCSKCHHESMKVGYDK